jgi:hypothetical protein
LSKININGPIWPVQYSMTFAVVISIGDNTKQHELLVRDAVRRALIEALPPGTGVGEVSSTIGFTDAYKKADAK